MKNKRNLIAMGTDLYVEPARVSGVRRIASGRYYEILVGDAGAVVPGKFDPETTGKILRAAGFKVRVLK